MENNKQRRRPKKKSLNVKIDGLTEETVAYYVRVSETFNEGFPSEDDRDLFLNNVFAQLAEEAVPVCRFSITSHIVENLITMATLSQVRTILTVLCENKESICVDRCASHVLQKLLCLLPKFIATKAVNYREATEDEAEEVTDEVALIRLVLDLSQFMLDSLELFLRHMYASHVLRALLQVLGGTSVNESVLRSRGSRRGSKEGEKKEEVRFPNFDIPAVFKARQKTLIKSIFSLEQFGAHLTDVSSSPVIQTSLLVLNKVDPAACQKYLKKVIKAAKIEVTEDNPDKIPPVVLDNVGSYLIEQVLSLASPKVYGKLYRGLFKGRLLEFSLHPSANFVLQSLIKSCKDSDMFQEVVEEVFDSIESTLALGRFGIIVSLADACLRLGCKQDRFRTVLMDAFHCREPAERQSKLVPLLASLSTYEVFFNLPDDADSASTDTGQKTSAETTAAPILTTINYHGALLLQKMLQFGNPKPVVNGFLDLKPVELRNMSCDACGSHVIEAFYKSSTIGEKSKEALLNKFQGVYVDLACDKFGSRVLEVMWKSVRTKQKTQIAEELCQQENKVRGDKFGFFIHSNFALRHFRSRRDDWMGVQGSEAKKRKLFKELLDPVVSPKKQKTPSAVPDSTGNADDSEEEAANRLLLQDSDDESTEAWTKVKGPQPQPSLDKPENQLSTDRGTSKKKFKDKGKHKRSKNKDH